MTETKPQLNLALYGRAADAIEQRGFWDGHPYTEEERAAYQDHSRPIPVCIGLAILDLNAPGVEKDEAMDHLARQLGHTGDPMDANAFVFNKNDEFAGRPEEGKAWAVDTLRKLARGESLV